MVRPVRCNFCIHMVEDKSTKTYECWANEDEKGIAHKKIVNVFEPKECEKFERYDTRKGRMQ